MKRTIRFPENNNILYICDHKIYTGVPSSIDFTPEIINNKFVNLSGEGYGLRGCGSESYGNGSMIVYGSDIDSELLSKIVRIYEHNTRIF